MRNTVLVTIQKASAELGQTRPQLAVSSEDQETQQMLALLVAVCDELQQMHNWTELLTPCTITTVPGQEAYDLPYDFSRLANSTVWDVSNRLPVTGPVTDMAWAAMKSGLATGPVESVYRIAGGKLHLSPLPLSSRQITFDYISSNYVIGAGDFIRRQDFTKDADNYVFDDRLVINALKLKFNEVKGFDTANYLADFNRSLEAVRSANGSAGTLNVGGRGGGMPLLSGRNIPDGSWK